MIARIWHGKVLRETAENYHCYLIETGLKDYELTKGNKGVLLFKRDEGNITHFYTFSLWAGFDSIKEFAGEEFEKARYYPGDKDYLLEFEPLVQHFEVLEKLGFH